MELASGYGKILSFDVPKNKWKVYFFGRVRDCISRTNYIVSKTPALRVYYVSNTCVLHQQYVCTTSALRVHYVSITCVLYQQYACTTSALRVYFISSTCVLRQQYVCACHPLRRLRRPSVLLQCWDLAGWRETVTVYNWLSVLSSRAYRSCTLIHFRWIGRQNINEHQKYRNRYFLYGDSSMRMINVPWN